jgi:hypothetical protein
MRGRLAVALALALAAGCGGGGGGPKPDAADAKGDATPETVIVTMPPPVDAHGEDADVPPPSDGADAGGGAAGRDGAAATDADSGSRDGAPETNSNADAPNEALASLCAMAVGTLEVPSGPVLGVLSGQSRNEVVSCGGGISTPGPEAIYALAVDEETLVEIRVDSDVSTVVALRGACTEGIAEIACGRPGSATPPPVLDGGVEGGGFGGFFGFDAGSADANGGAGNAGGNAGAGGSSGGNVDASSTSDASPLPASFTSSALVRARLKPGTYTILVDQPFAFDPPAHYAVTVRSIRPATNATCAAPMLLSAPATVRTQELDFASTPSVECGTTQGSALYYSVGVPSGQRLTVRATPIFGDRAWQPRIEAFASCKAAMCLAEGHSSSGTTQQLDWINNGPNWRLVTLAVSSDTQLTGARFDLSVSVIDQLATCARPMAVSDGTVLINQDLHQAPPPEHATCTGALDHALFYAAQLMPQQQLNVTVVGSNSQSTFSSPALVSIRAGCDSLDCQGANTMASFTNTSADTKIVIIEVSPQNFSFESAFDLHISIPLPPASINVLAGDALVTSESGTTQTFQIKLGSPPTANVTIPLSSDTPTEGSVSPSSLVFTVANWDQAQTVTLKGVDDQLSDGTRPYTILTGAATSPDGRYNAIDANDVAAENLDDDPGIDLLGATALVTTEWGGARTLQLKLNHPPSAPVYVPLASTDATEGVVSPSELVFTATDWNQPKTVTVTGVDDAVTDGPQVYSIAIGPLTSADPVYAGLDPPDVVVHNRDDDFKPTVAKLISSDHICALSGQQQVVIDDFGTIYAVVGCEMGILAFASSDGGATFKDPVAIPNTESVGDLRIATGRGGVVYLFYENQQLGAMFTATRDGGATWAVAQQIQGPPSNFNQLGAVRIGAGGDTVVLGLSTFGGVQTALIWHSLNGGRSFAPRVSLDAFNTDIFVRPDGKTVWVNTDGQLRKSTDAGATFTLVGSPGVDTSVTATMNDTALFSAGFSQLSIIDLTGTGGGSSDGGFGGGSFPTQFFSTTISSPMDIQVDAAGNVLLLGDTDTGNLRVSRLGAGDQSVGAPKTVGPRADSAGLVMLSPTMVGAVFSSGNLILFASTATP